MSDNENTTNDETRKSTTYTDTEKEFLFKAVDILQANIKRMSDKCSLVKGWTITLVAALCGISLSISQFALFAIAVVVTVMLSILDAYYLKIERGFRKNYNETINLIPEAKKFLNINPTKNSKTDKDKLRQAFFSTSIMSFYGIIFIISSLLLVWGIFLM
ncbi:MAG: hypothetical protein LBM41_06190 [Ruminococcus sp.]|jgi:hypothetical protein|nr:hypothetical protein [Ruminococcus sp.]